MDAYDQQGNTNAVGDATPERQSDAAAVIESLRTGKALDPEIRRRVSERSERATEDLRMRYGTLEVAVDLVREIRDDE